MKKLFVFFFVLISLFTIHYSLFTREALAHCPLCVAGAGVGLTLSRWIGVDDSITGLWLASFLGAMSFWIYPVLLRKIHRQDWVWVKPLVYVLIFASTIWSFYKFNLVIRMEKMFGLDKLTFGMVAGGATLYLVDEINNLIIRLRGKVFLPYQRIIVSLGSVILLSFLDYYLIGYYL